MTKEIPVVTAERPERKPRRLTAFKKALIFVGIICLLVGVAIGGLFIPYDLPNREQGPTTSSDGTAKTLGSDLPTYDPATHYCPEPGSWEANEKAIGSLTLNSMASEDFLVMSDRPVVQIIGSSSTTGLIRICGGPGKLVMTGAHSNLRVFFGDPASRIIIVDPEPIAGVEYFDDRLVFASGAMYIASETCTTRGQKGVRPCGSYVLK